MNLASTIKMMAEKKDAPPFDVSKADYAGAAKELTQYAKTKGGMDKNDFLAFANRMSAIANKKAPRVTAKFARDLMDLDTSPREKIVSVMRDNGIKVTVQGGGFKIEDYTIEDLEQLEELDEAMVRGKEVFDKTFANKTQADNFAKKNGGRVKQVGRVFYVFKEAPEDNEPASPDEGSMAMQQLEFIEYAADKIGDHIEQGGKFPEWMQNKLATVNDNMQSLYSQIDQDGEEMDEARRDPSKSGGSGYDLYHKDFSSAMQHAYKYAKDKLGVEIDPKEIDDKVASGPRKPSKGKTNTYRLMGKDGKKGVQVQVANLDDKKFELNMYKESVELDEAYKTPAEAKAYEDGKKAVAKKVSYDDNPNKKGTKEYTAWSKGHNDARARMIGKRYTNEEVEMNEEVNLDELFESAFEEELAEAMYQVDIKGAGRETVMAKNEKDAIAKASKKMKVHSFKSSDVTVKLAEEVEEKLSLEDTLKAIWEGKKLDPVNKKAVKKDFDDRKDKDLDNDGDVDDSDEYLHKRRKAVSKAMEKDSDKAEAEQEKEVSDKEDEPKGKVGKSNKQTKVDVNPSIDEEKGEEMTSAEMEKKDEIMKSLEKKKDEFVKKYGDRAKEVMARTAIKMAKKHA